MKANKNAAFATPLRNHAMTMTVQKKGDTQTRFFLETY